MLLKYLESFPLLICVASQIRGTLSWNPKQFTADGSHNTAYLWCSISYLMLLSRNLFLCLHLETNSVRLFNNFFGSDLAIISFSVKHKSIYCIYITTDSKKIFFTYVHFLKVDNSRADTTSTWPPCLFLNFIFEMYKGFWFLKMAWRFIP